MLLAFSQWDPQSWRVGCIANGLVCGAVHHYCLGGCSAVWVFARRLQQVRGAGAGAASRCPPSLLSLPRVPGGARGGLLRPGLPCPSLLETPFQMVCALCELGLVAVLVRVVCWLCVHVLALSRCSRPTSLFFCGRTSGVPL